MSIVPGCTIAGHIRTTASGQVVCRTELQWSYERRRTDLATMTWEPELGVDVRCSDRIIEVRALGDRLWMDELHVTREDGTVHILLPSPRAGQRIEHPLIVDLGRRREE